MKKTITVFLMVAIYSTVYADYKVNWKIDYSTITEQSDAYLVGKMNIGTSTSAVKISISSQAIISVGTGIKEIKISSNVYTVGYSSAAKFYGDGTNVYNVNSDKLDNNDSTYFAIKSDVATSTNSLKTSITNLEISTGTLLSKTSATATYLFKNEKATDSDKLDGYDYLKFVSTDTTQTISGAKTFTPTTIFSSATFSGNVGIGETVPDAKLHIKSAGSNCGIRIEDTSNGSYAPLFFETAGAEGATIAYWDSGHGTYPSLLTFDNSGAPNMVINTSGNVGIGTTNPGAKFVVVGGSSTFRGLDTQTDIAAFGSASGAFKVVISTSGNVGIGTTAPGQKFTVSGSADANNLIGQFTSSGHAGLRINASAASSTFVEYTRGGTPKWSTGVDNTGSIDSFYIYDRINSQYRVKITTFGNVGIGYDNPTSTLTVNGNVWIKNDCSADTFTDHTPYPPTKEVAYKSILSMQKKVDKDEIDHLKLDKYILHTATKTYEMYNEITKSTDTISEVEYGRNLSAVVSCQNEVIKSLIERIEVLEAKQ